MVILSVHLISQLIWISLFSGVVDYLSTEISTSKQKKFPLVTFLDTPGLVDGDMNYPFDVNEVRLEGSSSARPEKSLTDY